ISSAQRRCSSATCVSSASHAASRRRTPSGRRRSAPPRAGSRPRGSRSRRRSPPSTVAGPTRSTGLRAGGRRFGRWSRCGRRSAWRWYGSDWCWAATCPPPHGSRRASASERRAVTAIGVGVDLVEVSRVAAIIADKGSRVFQRLLTPTERAYCESRPDPATHVAVRLAAKEAVYKALQGSEAARGIGWREIEAISTPEGRPDVRLTGFAAARAGQLGVERVLLSLSHTHQAAVAVVVLERGVSV